MSFYLSVLKAKSVLSVLRKNNNRRYVGLSLNLDLSWKLRPLQHRMLTRLRHWCLAAAILPGLLLRSRHRVLFREIQAFEHALPGVLKQPLPGALRSITLQSSNPLLLDEDTTRQLSDLAALLDRRSPLGLCLRRSLTRYHFLRRLGLPVVLQFGAKFVGGKPDRNITGHAWLTLFDVPYYEADENWQGFTVMFRWPETV